MSRPDQRSPPEISRALARPVRTLPSQELQELWFATQRRQWNTLVVVPAHAGGSAFAVARALVDVGSLHRRIPLRLLSAEGLNLDEIASLVMEMSPIGGSAANQVPTIIALEPIVVNPFGTAVALAADAALLCVEMGETDLDSARRTIEQIGRDRFIGSVILRSGH